MEWLGWAVSAALAVACLSLWRLSVTPKLAAESARLEAERAAFEQRKAEHAAQADDERAVVDRRSRELARQEQELTLRAESVEAELARIGGLTPEQAKEEIIGSIARDARLEGLHQAREIERQFRAEAEREARKIVVGAIQRIAAEQTSEVVVSTISLPNEEMKGRVIGREGRNIRAFEQVTGATLYVDETPQTVLLSCFDPERREVARATIEALIADGVIHPARIEQQFERAKRGFVERVREVGRDAAARVGITDLADELVELLGRLSFRTSYGQNVLEHLIECAQLAGLIAAELGLDVEQTKRAAFLHDVGKAIASDGESHAMAGAQLLRKLGENEDVCHAVESHHNEVEPRTAEALITQAVDAISGSRPGARRESLENYVERMETLERIAGSKPGVAGVYAVQAGREVRVMVLPGEVDDRAAQALAAEIAAEIGEKLTLSGRIRVTVIRESRATAFAS